MSLESTKENQSLQALRSRRTEVVLLALGLAVVGVTLVRVVFNEFVWDDKFLIEWFEGLGDVGSLKGMLTSPFWSNSSYISTRLTDFWRPLTTLLVWITAVFTESPAAFHALSIMAALAAALSVRGLLVSLCDHPRAGLIATWMLLLFLAHPMCAEVLCMVVNMSDHLCLAFLILSVKLILDYHSRKRNRLLVGAALASMLACMSKELGVLAVLSPLAGWMLARAVDERRSVRSLLSLGPWISCLVPVALYLVMRHMVIISSGAASSFQISEDFSPEAFFLGLGQVVERVFAPAPKGAHSFVFDGQIVPWLLSVSAAGALAFMVARAVAFRRSITLSLVGALMAIALLAPSLLTVDVSDDAYRFPVRYFHLPLVGVIIAAWPLILEKWSRLARYVIPAAVILLALLSWVRIGEWRDQLTFFRAEVEYNPDALFNLMNLSHELVAQRHYEEADKTLSVIESRLSESQNQIRASVYDLRAKIFAMRDGDTESATSLATEALVLDRWNLLYVFDLAKIREMAGRPDQALTILEKALSAPWFQDYRRGNIEAWIARLREKYPALTDSGDHVRSGSGPTAPSTPASTGGSDGED